MRAIGLIVCIILLLLGREMLSNTDRYTAPYEDPATLPEYRGISYTVLLPGQTTRIGGPVRSRSCLQWYAELGPSSVSIDTRLYRDGQWVSIVPDTMCAERRQTHVSYLTNITSQRQLVYMIMNTRARQSGGYLRSPHDKAARISDYPKHSDVYLKGIFFVVVGLGVAVLSFTGLSWGSAGRASAGVSSSFSSTRGSDEKESAQETGNFNAGTSTGSESSFQADDPEWLKWGDDPCPHCDGTGLCQDDYHGFIPGLVSDLFVGADCPSGCTGTAIGAGNCPHCNGTGSDTREV